MNIHDLHRINELTADNREFRQTNETLRNQLEYASLNARWQRSQYERLQRDNESIRERCAVAEAELCLLRAEPRSLGATK